MESPQFEKIFREKGLLENLYEYKNEIAIITIILAFLLLVTMFVIGLVLLFMILNLLNSMMAYRENARTKYVMIAQFVAVLIGSVLIFVADPFLGVFSAGIFSGSIIIFDDFFYRTPEMYVPVQYVPQKDVYKERIKKINEAFERKEEEQEETSLPVNIFSERILFDKRNFVINDVYVFSVKIVDWPARLSFGFIDEMFSPLYPVAMSVKLHYIPDDSISNILDMEKRSAEVKLQLTNPKKYSEIEKLNLKLVTLNESINYVVNKQGHFYTMDIAFYAMSKNRQEAYNYLKKVETSLKRNLFKISTPLFNEQRKYFEFLMPYNYRSLPSRFMQSHAVAMHLPFLSEIIYMDGGVFIGINERSSTPIIFDRWSGKFSSSHMIISGTTGYGKSYFVKILIMREFINLIARGFEPRVFVIDPFGEYRDFANALGGMVISIKDNPINLLSIWDYFAVSSEEERLEKIRNKIAAVKGFLSMLFEFDKEMEADLDKMLMDIYSETPSPTFSYIYEKVRENENYSKFEKYFYQLSKGSMSVFNTQNEIDISSNLIVFDLTGIEGAMLSYYMFIVLNFIYQNIIKDMKPKFVIIDESWRVMEHEYSANFLAMMFRHVRHWNASMTVITQNMDDFLSTKEGLSIANNSVLHVLFKHMNISKAMNDFYGFNDFERGYLLNAPSPTQVGYARALARFANINQEKVPIRIYATPYEHTIATTKPEEVERKRQIRGE